MTEIQEPLTKESENLFSFWCSGRLVFGMSQLCLLSSKIQPQSDLLRICCEGMLVELKLLKRQDLVNLVFILPYITIF